jgi:hypothetical protein
MIKLIHFLRLVIAVKPFLTILGTRMRVVVLNRINPSGVTFLKKREVYGFLAKLTFSLLVFQMSRRLLQLLDLVV